MSGGSSSKSASTFCLAREEAEPAAANDGSIRNEHGDRLARSRDDHSLAVLDLVQQAGQVGLGFVDVHLAHELTLADHALWRSQV
jgi:hypothetical protein